MKTLVPAIALGWLFSLACSSALAEGSIYKWTDAKGRLHFSNAPTREAEAVDDSLPPASTFGTEAEPTPPTTASTAPVPEARSPRSGVDATPPTESEPTATGPSANDEPGLAAEGSPAMPAPSASAGLPAQAEPSDSGESDSEPE